MLLGELALEIGVAAADFVHKSSAVTVHGVRCRGTWCAVVYRSATDVKLTFEHWCNWLLQESTPAGSSRQLMVQAGHVGQAVGLC